MNTNPIGWFEIYVQDMDRATKFYEEVLQVKLDRAPDQQVSTEMDMKFFPGDMQRFGSPGSLVKMDGVPSGGGGTLIYFISEDCSIEEARVEKAGGSIHRSRMSIGQYGFIVLAQDTEGNMIGFHSMK